MTRNTMQFIEELKREEAVKEAGFERTFLREFFTKGLKSVHVCRECGSVPKAYRRGTEYSLACTRCGKVCTSEYSSGSGALKAWNEDNQTAPELRITNNGYEDPERKKTFFEVIGEDGNVKLVEK